MAADEVERPEGNDRVVSKGPCDKCDTEYGFATYADGHGFCFACGHKVRGDGAPAKSVARAAHPSGLISPKDAIAWKLPKRRLEEDTLRRYGYFVARHGGQEVHVAPYYTMEGDLACQKLRMPDKSFVTLKASDVAPSINECQLFGRQVFGDKHDRKVVITEGELDAMSCAQATGFKFPCVSVNAGSKGAAKSLKRNYLWLDRFEEIILWFDDDEPGRQATAECAPLFAIGKVKIARAI